MAKYRCNACQGEYSDQLSDGMAYYHACPPQRVVAGVVIPIPNRRDENAPLRYARPAEGPPKLVQSEGAGRIKLED